jgi:HPt (histidine-containing phosphotransfer) domain-containing protein
VPRAFDDADLLERVDNDWTFLTETVQMLAADGPVLLEEVRRSMDAGDSAGVGRAAHTLKGMASNFCAPAAEAAALEVERVGKAGDLAAAPAAVAALDAALQALIADLNGFLSTRT